MKRKISFLISELKSSGGTQRMLCTLSNLLIEDFDIKVLVNEEGSSFYKLDSRIDIVVLPSIEHGYLNRNIFIYKVLKKNDIDYFISLDSNSIVFNSLFLPKKTKLIIWEHFSLKNNYKKLHFTISRHYAVLRSKKLVLLSNSEVSSWTNYNPLSWRKSELIYNSLTVKKAATNPGNRQKSKYILAIGNDIETKGFDILINCWKDLNNDYILRIIGLNDDQVDMLNSDIKHYSIKNIEIYGKVKNIEEFYESSSIFLLSSRKEATPLVLIESQAYGLPAIVFNHLPSVLEIIDESALIVEFDETGESFKNAINRLVNDNQLYEKLSLNAFKNSNRFDEQVFKAKWLEVLS